jgi:hypothetical protein
MHVEMESPVDYVRTQINSTPLASDSINMDVRYASNDPRKGMASSLADNVASYISTSMGYLGASRSGEMTRATATQVSDQVKKHNISGTLVISVSCTHKNASVLAPFVITVDKGIRVWNNLFNDVESSPQT